MDNNGFNDNNVDTVEVENGENKATSNNGNAPEYTLWLVLGIIQIVCICCCNPFTTICGIITVVFVYAANNAYKINNTELYQSKIKSAKIVSIIGLALFVGGIILNIVLGMCTTLMNNVK